jgi:hypothetical protein
MLALSPMLMTSNKIQDLLITFFKPDSLPCIQLTDERFQKVFFHLLAIVQIKSKPGSHIQAILTFIHAFYYHTFLYDPATPAASRLRSMGDLRGFRTDTKYLSPLAMACKSNYFNV